MRILSPQVGLDQTLGGGRHDFHMLGALARAGHEVTILLPRHLQGRCAAPEGCAVRWVPVRWRLHPFAASLAFLPSLLHAVRELQPDAIRVHSPACLGLAALAIRRVSGVPLVASFHHQFETFRGARWTERHLLHRFDEIVTVSEFSRKQLESMHARIGDRVTVAYNGISPVFALRVSDRRGWRMEHGLAPDLPLFVAAGALIPRKNLDFMVDVMEAWTRGGGRGRLVIAGEGTLRSSLERSIAQRGLGQTVSLWGCVDDSTLAGLFECADAVVFPSLAEGFGLVAAEALACGTPVLAADRGALPEVVRHGVDGFLLPVDRGVQPWVEHMQLLVDDAPRRDEMSRRAAEDVRRRFDWDRAAADVTVAFTRAVRGRDSSVAVVAGP